MKPRRARWLIAGLLALAGAGYARWLRPWMLGWGSTAEERARPLPGDALVPEPTHITTRAITIAAPPAAVWPWLAQIGQDRAGFYTHNWVERLLGSGISDVHTLHPEWQALEPGDLVRTNRELRPGQPIGWPVAQVEPERALVLRSKALPVGTYAFVLEPAGETGTRLLARDRAIWP